MSDNKIVVDHYVYEILFDFGVCISSRFYF